MTEQTGVEPITDEQTWVEGAARVLADAPAAEPIADLLAESLWPLVAPLVTAAEDAERRLNDIYDEAIRHKQDAAESRRRIQAVRDLCMHVIRCMLPEGHEGDHDDLGDRGRVRWSS